MRLEKGQGQEHPKAPLCPHNVTRELEPGSSLWGVVGGQGPGTGKPLPRSRDEEGHGLPRAV